MTKTQKLARFKELNKLAAVTKAKYLSEDKRAQEVIRNLMQWREANKLSQRQAVAVMASCDYPVNLQTLQAWEQGRYSPEPLAAKALETFLAQVPTVTDAPVYGKRSRFSEKDLTEISRLRDEGQTLVAIAGRFGVGASYMSRILSGARLGKVAL